MRPESVLVTCLCELCRASELCVGSYVLAAGAAVGQQHSKQTIEAPHGHEGLLRQHSTAGILTEHAFALMKAGLTEHCTVAA